MAAKSFTPFPRLATGRFTLRQPVSGDIHEIFQLRSDSSVNKFLERPPARSIDEAGTFIRAINEKISLNESVYWAIAENAGGKLVGTICLFNFSHNDSMAEIGYELLPAFQRKGVMREAVPAVLDYGFYEIGLQIIEAYTQVNNQDSTKLLHHFHFIHDGGADGDFMVLRLTAQGWKEQRSRN